MSAEPLCQIPRPSGVSKTIELFRAGHKVPNQLFEKLHNLGDLFRLVHTKFDSPDEPDIAANRKLVKKAVRNLKDLLLDEKNRQVLDDEYRKQLEQTGERLIDYLEAKQEKVTTIQTNRLLDKLSNVMIMMNIHPTEPRKVLQNEKSGKVSTKVHTFKITLVVTNTRDVP